MDKDLVSNDATPEAPVFALGGVPLNAGPGDGSQVGDRQGDGSLDRGMPPVVTSAEAVPPVVATSNPTSSGDHSTTGDHATGDHATSDDAAAESIGRRPGEIMRLLGLVRELRHDLAASLATQCDLRLMNEAYAARVGSIPLQEEAAQARLIELAEVRREAATHANDANVLRDELASLRRTTSEADAARGEREARMLSEIDAHVEALERARREAAQAAEAALGAQTAAAETQRASDAQLRSELQHQAEALERAQSEAERLVALNAARDRELIEERHRRATVEAAAADAAETVRRAEAAVAEALKANAALQSQASERSDHVDALESRAAALQDELDRLRGWHDAVTATKLWHIIGRPGGRLDERPGVTAR